MLSTAEGYFTSFNKYVTSLTRPKLNTEKRLETFGAVKEMLTDGLPLDHCLSALHERKVFRGSKDAVVLERWRNAMARGKDFASAIEGDIPGSELVLIRAGQRAANIPMGLEQAIKVTKAQQELRNLLFSKMTYPLMLFLVIVGMLFGYGVKFVPIMVKVLPLKEWPASGKALYAVSTFVVDFSLLLFLLLAVAVTTFAVTLPRLIGPLRSKLDRIPPWNLYRTYVSASFLIALAALLRAGVPFSEALANIRKGSSPWLRWHVDQIKARATSGKKIGDSLDTGMLDDNLADLVFIYSKVSKFDEAIKAIGERAVEMTAKVIGKKLDTVRTIALVMVGVIASSIYMTNFEITQTVTNNANSSASRIRR